MGARRCYARGEVRQHCTHRLVLKQRRVLDQKADLLVNLFWLVELGPGPRLRTLDDIV